jgi:hypothetical protein
MGTIKKQYQMRGLDTRSNKLMREEGTASDCRNVYKDSRGNLIKRPDFNELTIPRAAVGEVASAQPTGDFVDKLPHDSTIIDFYVYEDHILLVVGVEIPFSAGRYGICNKFYKYFESTNTVELIPIASTQAYSFTYGYNTGDPRGSVFGKISFVLQENILYFMGQYSDTDVVPVFPKAEVDAYNNNLCFLFSYDGEMVKIAGTPTIYTDTIEDTNTSLQAQPEEYVRLVPFTFDAKDRLAWGNYTTHKSVNDLAAQAQQTVTVPISFVYDNQFREFSVKYTGVSGTVNDGDTITCDDLGIASDLTVAPNQYLYHIRKSVSNVGTDFTESFELYKFKILDTDTTLETITIGEFQWYNELTNVFEAVPSFDIEQNDYLGNVITAVYGSDNYTFGYTFRGLKIHTSRYLENFVYSYNTAKIGGANTTTSVSYYNQPFLLVAKSFEDGYDEESSKLVPPKGKQVIDYLGALVIVDHQYLYFSDISVGGSTDAFTPFDNFQVGSSKRGPITGVFANETFLTVFREEEAYYITGNIFLLNYRIQSVQSTRIGCLSPRSIIDFNGAGMFLSQRGFYVCQQGGQMPEISNMIETIFTDNALNLNLDLASASSEVDYNRELILFHVSSTTDTSGYLFVYSYYFNEWYIWSDMNCSAGFKIINKAIYYSDGSNLYKESNTNISSNAYYRSNFETLGVPSYTKKFLQLLLFTIDMPDSGSIGVKTYRDWDIENTDTDEAKTVLEAQVDVKQRLNPARSKSLAFEIVSDSGETLIINGYEYEFAGDVQGFVDDD